MSRNHFEEIISILHYNDNNKATPEGSNNYNKLHKIQPLIDHFRKRFKKVVTPETCQAVDEMMVPFKGCHVTKAYMQKKPIKWGYKLWWFSIHNGFQVGHAYCEAVNLKIQVKKAL